MNTVAAIDLVLALITRLHRVSQMLATARAAGQESLTDEQLDQLIAEDDAARDELRAAIARAKSEGR